MLHFSLQLIYWSLYIYIQLRYNTIVMDRQTFVLNASKTDIEEAISNERENENAITDVPY